MPSEQPGDQIERQALGVLRMAIAGDEALDVGKRLDVGARREAQAAAQLGQRAGIALAQLDQVRHEVLRKIAHA
ncbi:hypothetical protein D3C78_1574990 [compost metagenome]